MPQVPKNVMLFALGLTGLATLAAVSSFALTANNLAGLRGVRIAPFGDFTIDPGEKLLLTAEGDYVTYTVPLRATWEIKRGENLGYFVEDCDAQKSCTFQADDYGGDVTVYIEASGHTDEAVIHIRDPRKKVPPRPVQNPFTDELPEWAGDPIVQLKERNILSGYNNGRFGAGDTLTRGQLITIFHRTLRNTNLIRPMADCKTVYADVPPGHYAYEAACAFRANGWTDALSTLDVNENVSRGETASYINRVLGPSLLEAKGLRLGKVLAGGQVFTDVGLSNTYFGDTAVTKAVGIMNGNPDGTFGPGKTLNRAEAATIFWRIVQAVERR